MSRSGYTDDGENIGLCRGNIARATAGKRGQRFFRELVTALDALPEKRLIRGELEEEDGAVCALGALRKAKGVALEPLRESDWDELGNAFHVAPMLTQEVMYENDEAWRCDSETPEERWARMRKWAAEQIIVTPEEVVATEEPSGE